MKEIADTEKLSRLLKVLGDATRLGIALSIGSGACSVTEIVQAVGLSQTLVSFHLRIMREAGVVTTKRNGPFILYRLTDPLLLQVLFDLSRMSVGSLPVERVPPPPEKQTAKTVPRRSRVRKATPVRPATLSRTNLK